MRSEYYFWMKWNDRLKAARDRAKISNTVIARHCGISDASVSDWMSGKTKQISAEHLLSTCKLLGVSPFFVMLGEEDAMTTVGAVASDTNINATETLRLLSLYAQSDQAGKKSIMGAAVAAASIRA